MLRFEDLEDRNFADLVVGDEYAHRDLYYDYNKSGAIIFTYAGADIYATLKVDMAMLDYFRYTLRYTMRLRSCPFIW